METYFSPSIRENIDLVLRFRNLVYTSAYLEMQERGKSF